MNFCNQRSANNGSRERECVKRHERVNAFNLVVVLVGATLFKKSRQRRFKSDRDEIWQDCFSTKYASTESEF